MPAPAAVGAAQTIVPIIQALRPDDGAKGIAASQPGLVAATRFGPFGEAFSGFLGQSSGAVFQNQSPWALAALNMDSVGSSLEGFTRNLVSDFVVSPVEQVASRIPPLAWVFGIALLVLLVMRRR